MLYQVSLRSSGDFVSQWILAFMNADDVEDNVNNWSNITGPTGIGQEGIAKLLNNKFSFTP